MAGITGSYRMTNIGMPVMAMTKQKADFNMRSFYRRVVQNMPLIMRVQCVCVCGCVCVGVAARFFHCMPSIKHYNHPHNHIHPPPLTHPPNFNHRCTSSRTSPCAPPSPTSRRLASTPTCTSQTSASARSCGATFISHLLLHPPPIAMPLFCRGRTSLIRTTHP
jgi:hypothetical protein